jgi:hypothetical protein
MGTQRAAAHVLLPHPSAKTAKATPRQYLNFLISRRSNAIRPLGETGRQGLAQV